MILTEKKRSMQLFFLSLGYPDTHTRAQLSREHASETREDVSKLSIERARGFKR